MNQHEKKSVVQSWLDDLTWKQQTVVLAALRGCDGVPKDDPSKIMHKYLRSCILENAATATTSFMSTTDSDYTDPTVYLEKMNHAKALRRDIDKYPTHYILHFMHAAEIIGYNHPTMEVAKFWREVYYLLVDAMHLQNETKEMNDYRLRDGVDSD